MQRYWPILVILSDIVTVRIRHGLTILGLKLTYPAQLDLDLTQHITNLTLLKITYIAHYHPILPNIVRYCLKYGPI